MNPLSRVVVRKVGHRGAALLFFAFLDGVYSYWLLNPPDPLPAAAAFIDDILPLWAWGIAWGISSVVCAFAAFAKSDRWGFAAAMLVQSSWGLLYLYGALSGANNAYLGSAVWLCLSAWVGIIAHWPEPPDQTGDYGWEEGAA